MTIFRLSDFIFKALASCLAINVFPVPGGPYNKIPLTCFTPNFYTTSFENLLDAKVLLNILNNYPSNPPIPIFYGVKSALNKESPYYEFESLPPFVTGLLKTWPGAGIIYTIVLATKTPYYFYFPPITILLTTP